MKIFARLFLLQIAGCFIHSSQASAAEYTQVVSYASVWKYDQSGLDLGTAWREVDYPDSAWPSGQGALGFPSNEILPDSVTMRTLLQRYISGGTGPQVTNYYFRHTFQWNQSPIGTTLVMTNLIDDGAVFYLNGTELARAGMPQGPISPNTFSTRAADISQYGPDVFRVVNPPLIQGANVLSVELHQGTATSGDAAFAMSLWIEFPTPGPVTILTQPTNQTVVVGQSTTLEVLVSGTPPYFYAWSKDGNEIPDATNRTHTISNFEASDTGIYQVRARNALGEALSSRVLVVGVPPPLVLIPFDHEWRWNASGADLDTSWRETDYPDSEWPAGPGPFGEESAVIPVPIRTPLNVGIITYYFRTTFEVDEDPKNFMLVATNQIDDGVIYYLNGAEVNRIGMSPVPHNHQTTADRGVGDAVLETRTWPSTNLVRGVNVLAAEVHQATQASSDIVFGLRLHAAFLPPPFLNFQRNGAQLILFWSEPTNILESAPALQGPWDPVPNQTNPFTTAFAGNQRFYRVRR